MGSSIQKKLPQRCTIKLAEAAQTSMKAANDTSASLVDAVCYKITVSAGFPSRKIVKMMK